jgi:hypothetical protein
LIIICSSIKYHESLFAVLIGKELYLYDNVSYHISKITREYINRQKKKDWLTVIHLPKRAPYLNPNERKVNQKIKSDVCVNKFYTNIEGQKDAISEYLDNRFGRWCNDICDDT